MISRDRLLVYFKVSGSFYIVQNNIITKSLKLWPRKALQFYKVNFKDALERDEELEGFFPFFQKFIVDRDDEKYFYLHFGKPIGENKTYLYKFDLDGNLIKVLYIEEISEDAYTMFWYKKNGLFYAAGSNKDGNETIFTYKEEAKR
jgi:hypothetical protein